MAQKLKITIQIDQKGSETIDKIIDKVKELNETLSEGSIAPFIKGAEEVKNTIGKLAESVKNIRELIEDSILSVRRKTQDLSENTVSRLIDTVNNGVETLVARTSILAGSFAFFAANIDKLILAGQTGGASILSLFTEIGGAVSGASDLLGNIFVANLNLLSEGAFKIAEAVNLIKQGLFGITPFLQGVASITAGLVTSTATFFGAKFFLGEIQVLLGRILGRGQENLNVLTRATRLISLLDDGLNRTFKTIGGFLRLGFFTALSSFINPLFGLPGIINSITDLALVKLRKIGTRTKGFLGDGRAQFTIILDFLREILRKLLPQLLKIADSFVFILKKINKEQLDAIFSKMFGVEQRARGINARIKDIFSRDRAGKAKKEIAEIESSIGKVPEQLKKTSQESEKTGNAVRKLKFSFASIPTRAIGGFSGFLRKIPENFRKIKDRIDEFEKTRFTVINAKDLQRQANQVSKPIAQIKKQIEELLSFEKISERKELSGRQFSGKFSSALRQFITSAFDISVAKNFSQQHFDKLFQTILSQIGFRGEVKVSPTTVTLVAKEIARTVELAGKEGITGKTTGAVFAKAITQAISGQATKSLQESVKKSLSGIQDALKVSVSGGKISSELAKGILSEKEEVDKAIGKTVKGIADHLPQSPAKRGALRELLRMGREIPRQISQGMTAGQGTLSQTAARIAERIAGFFPRSPALFGPLVALPQMGLAIINQLVSGLKQGFSILRNTMEKLSNIIAKPLERIRDLAGLQLLSERVGTSVESISALRGAITELGGAESDLNFIFSRFRSLLSRDDELEKLEEFGLEINKIKESGDPILELLLQASESIKEFGIQSEEAREILQSLGVTGNSVVINLLLRGSAGLRQMVEDTSIFGGVVSRELAQKSLEINRVFNRLRQFRDFLFNDFLAPILPEIKEKASAIIDFIRENALQIRAFAVIAGQFLVNLSKLVANFVVLVVREPGKALNILINLISGFFSFTTNSIASFFSASQSGLISFLQAIGSLVFSFLNNFLGGLSDNALAGLTLLWAKIKKLTIDSIIDLFQHIPVFAGRILDLVINLLVQIGNLLLRFPGQIFTLLSTRIGNFATKLVIELSFKVLGTIKGSFLEDVVKKLGFNTSNIDARKKALLRGIDEVTEEAENIILGKGNNVKKEFDNIAGKIASSTGSFFTGIDSDVSEAEERFSETKGFGEIIKESAEKALPEIEKIGDAIKELGDDLTKPEVFDEFVGNFENSFDQIRQSFADAGLQEEFDKLISTFTAENAQDVLQELRDKIEEVKLGLEEVGPATGESREISKREGIFKEGTFQTTDIFKGDTTDFAPTVKLTKRGEQLITLGEKVGEVWGGLGDVFTEMFERSGKKMREFAIAAKAIGLSTAIVNVAIGVTQALRSLPPPLSFIQAAAVSLRGGLAIAKITSQGFAEGGIVDQGTTPTADDVPARLSRGEFVIPANKVSLFGPKFFEGIRTNKITPKDLGLQLDPARLPKATFEPKSAKFAAGGLVTGAGGNGKSERPINIVNFTDPEQFGQYLASTPAEERLLNFISNRSDDVKQILNNT